MKNEKITYLKRNLSLLFLISLLSVLCSAQENLKFSHFTIEDGLSQNTVKCMMQDDKGFVWIGTQDGLNRFDGYEFKIYSNEPDNLNSLSNSFIEVIFQDKDGFLWVGTRYGLNKFNLTSGTITRFLQNDGDTTTVSHSRITAIAEDKNGVLWVGSRKGLNRFDPITKTFHHFLNDTLDSSSISDNYVTEIFFDDENTMWVGTNNGLNRFNSSDEDFVHFEYKEDNLGGLSSNSVWEIFQDRNNNIWIGTGRGLNKFNKSNETFTVYKNIPEDDKSISGNSVQKIIEDKNGFLWIATNNGLNRFDPKEDNFINYRNILNEPKSISGNDINHLVLDNTGMIWVGIQGRGFNLFYPGQKKFNHFKTPVDHMKSLSSNTLWSFVEDRHENLWYGTSSGLFVYNPRTNQVRSFHKHDKIPENGIKGRTAYGLLIDKNNNLWIGGTRGLSRLHSDYIERIWVEGSKMKFVHFHTDKNNPKSYSGGGISNFLEDKIKGILWIGSFSNGLIKVENILSDDVRNIVFSKYEHSPDDSNSISHNWINIIVQDEKERLWIGTERGLDLMDEASETFRHFKFDPTRNNTISENSVSHMYSAENNILWIGTFGGGLNKFNIQSEEFTHYTMKDGLPNNNVYGILPGDSNYLWVSTNSGLSKFNIITESFRNYTGNDGLQSNEFNAGAYYKSAQGKLYFGGINGFNSFYQDSIKDNNFAPKIVFTQLKVLNKVVETGVSNNELGISDDLTVILQKNIAETDSINLSYELNVFSIQFSALHYQAPSENQYAYQLEGFDKEWVYASANNRRVTYTNLNPGTYTFKVKASNSDGVWSKKGKSLTIVIAPPFWKTWWFYSICIIVFFMILYTILNAKVNQVKIKSEKEYFKKQNEEKVTMMKEIHHRVKNNLQIVNSLLRLQSSQVEDENIVAMFEESQDRVLSMARLHEQLYQSEDLKHIDIKSHFKSLIEGLIHEYQVGIDVKLNIKVEVVDIGIKTLVPLGLMINELITNSLKYAFKDKKEGVIIFHLRHLEGVQHELIIGDDGIGIDKKNKGKGLGTELVQIFTEQLEGGIERLDREGTVFRIIFEKIDKA